MLRKLKNLVGDFKKKFFEKKHKENTPNDNFDFNKKLVYSLSKSKIPTLRQLKYIKRFLNSKEILALKLSIFLILVSSIFWSVNFYLTHLELTPVSGGEYTEGLIGAPKHINPLYSDISDVDSDIASLVFSSLYKRGSDGSLEKDIVETMEVSEDEKEYSIKLKENIKWHDGETLDSDDVVFTINALVDPIYQSPLRVAFSGVSAYKIDDLNIKIKLTQPYGAFKDLLTFGIMPAHLWGQLNPESFLLVDLNIRPIGSGPYKFKRLLKDTNTGKIVLIELETNEDYYSKVPYIETLIFKFYPNFEELLVALNENIINGVAYLPKELKGQVAAQNSINFHKLNLNQVLSLSFNQKLNEKLESKKVRKALATAINKFEINESIFSNDLRIIDSPILPESFAYKADIKKYDFSLDEAVALLNEDDWAIATVTPEDLLEEDVEENTKEVGAGLWMSKTIDDELEYLSIKISVLDSEDDIAIAEAIKSNWEKIGVKVFIEKYSATQLNSELLRDRNFEAILYSQTLSIDPDVYALWHSSQAVSGGNNISNYINSQVDKLLSEARLISNEDERKKMYYEFQDILIDEVPAVFLFSPNYTYLQEKEIKNFNVTSISVPSDRFSNISDWYINTGKKIIW